MAKLNVVQILPALNGGGVERGTLEVARALVERGHRSLVISTGGRLTSELIAEGSEHLNWPVGKKSLLTLRWVLPLRRWLMAQQIDILHVRSRMPAWIAWLAWRGMDSGIRPRFITTVHGLYSVSRYSAIMTKGERVIAVSDTVRDYLLRNYPKLSPTHIEVIHRGIDPEVFPYGYRPNRAWWTHWYDRYPQLRDALVLTLPGRITRLKGHPDFISLIARLRDRGLPVYGLIVGDTDPRHCRYVEDLHRQIETSKLARRVIFTGHRSDMREIYSASNMVLSLSQKPESFGRTVLEALSLGVPVVGYHHGGVGEILTRLYPLGLVPLGDPYALEAKLMTFIQAPPQVPAQQVFRLQTMLDRTLDLYQSLVTVR